jgi:enoyl reductase-like protein
MNQIENQRREITRRINDVRSNPRIPEERKQEIIQRLDEQRQRVILRGLQLARSIER